jgi:hypothetical protein
MSSYSKFKQKYCLVCGHDGSYHPLDPDHVATQKARPDLIDNPKNIMTLCRLHHTMKGAKGISFMCEKFPVYKQWLLDNGWTFDEFDKKWRLYS